MAKSVHKMQRIPIFTDEPQCSGGWHGQVLQKALAQRGRQAVFISLKDCVLDLSDKAPQVLIPGFERILPPAVFVRGVAGGTLQQITTRLNILHALQLLSVRVYNHGRAIERTVDKGMTSLLLRQQGIPTPNTWVCESRHHAEKILAQQESPLVIKPLFGSQGQGVRLILAGEALPVPMQTYVDGVYYLQQWIETAVAPHDYRVFVLQGRVIASMKRIGNGWVNNVAAGGHCESIVINEEMKQLALQAATALEIDYCGVDIIQAKTGEYFVLEVNSIPAWRGLQSVTEMDIAQALVDDFLRGIHA